MGVWIVRLLLVPLDDRPVTRTLPAMAGAVAGIEVVSPPIELLGTLDRWSDPAELAAWMRQHSTQLDGAVVSVDMLGHGGLVNSRRSTEPLEVVLGRLQVLHELRAAQPDLCMYAFNILQRISNSDSNQEEKPYWDRYGRAMFRLSQLTDAVDRYHRPEDERELATLREAIPSDLVEDYLRTRRRNHQLNLAMIEWAVEGIFDFLAITQDDANPLGFPALEQRALSGRIAELGAYGRVAIYPGADEVATTLVARLACSRAGSRPRVWARYSSVRGPLIVASYEDRPLAETVKGQVLAAGGLMADSPAEADLVMLLNTPAEAQAEAPLGIDYATVHTSGRNLDELVGALRDYQERGIPVALADVAYSNGADPALLPRVFQCPDPLDLLAFAGWNTAGNTIGSALGHAYLRLLALQRGPTADEERAHLALLLTRYLDDWGYQSVVRTVQGIHDLEEAYGITSSDLGTAAPRVSQDVQARLQSLYESHLRPHVDRHGMADVSLEGVGFPWNRLFEVELLLEVTPRA